jgi:hypothetical protein
MKKLLKRLKKLNNENCCYFSWELFHIRILLLTVSRKFLHLFSCVPFGIEWNNDNKLGNYGIMVTQAGWKNSFKIFGFIFLSSFSFFNFSAIVVKFFPSSISRSDTQCLPSLYSPLNELNRWRLFGRIDLSCNIIFSVFNFFLNSNENEDRLFMSELHVVLVDDEAEEVRKRFNRFIGSLRSLMTFYGLFDTIWPTHFCTSVRLVLSCKLEFTSLEASKYLPHTVRMRNWLKKNQREKKKSHKNVQQ